MPRQGVRTEEILLLCRGPIEEIFLVPERSWNASRAALRVVPGSELVSDV